MPIQKFKFGQEITSSKLNEIVSFVNNLEKFLENSQFWTENIDSKINGFQSQLNNIVTQVRTLLNTAESFDALLAAFVDLKTQYESLVAENVETLLENLFNPQSFFVNQDGFIVIGGVVTSTQLTGIIGPQGPAGANGLNGINGIDGKTILTGSTTPSVNLGNNGDLYLNSTSFDLFFKNNDVWILLINIKGPQGNVGPQGLSTNIIFRYFLDDGLPPLNNPPASGRVKYLEFKTFLSNETSDQINNKPWIRLQIRGNLWYPIASTGPNGEIFLNWSEVDEKWSDNPNGINIKGDQGPIGLRGPKGDSGNDFTILGLKPVVGDLPSTGEVGDAWFVGTTLPYTVYLWDTGLSTPAWVNVGPLQGPIGPAPTITANATSLSSTSDATVTTTNPSAGTFNLSFGIPRGIQGTRGSRIFSVSEDALFPTTASFSGITLIVGDIFISNESGSVRQVVNATVFELQEIYKLPFENQLIFRGKTTEAVSIGDVIQFAGVQGANKLVKKAVPSEINNDPDLIMGIAKENKTSNSFVEIVANGQITGFGSVATSLGAVEGDILYFASNSASNGLLTKTEPTGDFEAKIVMAAYIGGPTGILQVRTGTAHRWDEAIGIQAQFALKANDNQVVKLSGDQTIAGNKTFTGTTSGISKGMVGLENVDNTSDLDKPISTATQTALNGKANLASPSFTGTPLAPTASAGTNTTQLATTAFVKTAVDNVVNSAPGALDTLKELADALNNDANFATTVTNSLATKAPLDSPTFTGTVTLPSTTSIGNVSATEIGYVDGVTSSIQTQLNNKAATSHNHVISDVTNLETELNRNRTEYLNGTLSNTTLSTAILVDQVTLGSGNFYQVNIEGLWRKTITTTGPTFGCRILITTSSTSGGPYASGIFEWKTSPTIQTTSSQTIDQNLNASSSGTANIQIDLLNNSAIVDFSPFWFRGNVYAGTSNMNLRVEIVLIGSSGNGQTVAVKNMSMTAIRLG